MVTQLSSSQQRIRDLETLLIWEGSLENSRIREVFGLQMVQASRMVTAFMSEHKHDVARVTPHAPVIAQSNFKPLYSLNEPDEYLRLVEGARPAEVAPFITDARIDLSPTSSQLFATLNQACRLGLGVNIFYRSVNNPDGSDRLVFPHSMVRAARRWHVRAWCTLRQEFRDFTVGRIISAALTDEQSAVDVTADSAWHEMVDLVVAAHPALSEEQAQVLRHEYLASQISSKVNVRRALVSYVVQDLRLAIDPLKHLPPGYQLVLVNFNDFPDSFAVGSAS